MSFDLFFLFFETLKNLIGIFLANPTLLIVGALAFIILPTIKYIWAAYQNKTSGLTEIDHMTGQAFEQYLVYLFTKLGYQVQHIGRLGDYGGDLIIQKDGIKTLVQAKRQNAKVKESAVQQAIAAKEYYQCDQAMVVTNNYYWKHAWMLGKKTHTVLWTRKELAAAISQAG